MKHFTLIIPCLLFVSCTKLGSTITTNQYAIDLLKLEKAGLIKQNLEKKDAFFTLFSELIDQNFKIGGYNHRLNEIKSNWRYFEQSEFIIICGSVAKSDKDIRAFVWVLRHEEEITTAFLQIGGNVEEGKEYPSEIVPVKLTSEQRNVLHK